MVGRRGKDVAAGRIGSLHLDAGDLAGIGRRAEGILDGSEDQASAADAFPASAAIRPPARLA